MDDKPLPPGGITIADMPSSGAGAPKSPPAPKQEESAPSFGASITPPSGAPPSQPPPPQPSQPVSAPPSGAPPSPPPSPAADQQVPSSDTIVVPAAGAPPPSNPFIPQGIGQSGGTPPPAGGAPEGIVPPGNPMPRRLMMIGAGVVVLILLALIGKFVLGAIAGSKPVTITYWGLWEDNSVMQGVIDDFEAANPKIKVNYVKQSNREYRERMQAAIDRSDASAPDVFRFHNTWIYMLRNELLPAPADIMTASEFNSTFYPVASNDLVGGSSVYGIPMEIDGLGLYYNEDLFTAAGVTPPSTWEDVLNMVPQLTVKDGDTIQTSAIALGTTSNVENFSDIFALMMMQNGAKLITPTGAQAEEALAFYRKFATPSDPVYTWNDSMDNSIYAFATGKVAMILAPSWRAFDITQMNPDLHFKIAPVPQLPGSTVTWASYWVEGVSAKSKYPQQSWQFVKYITSKDVVTKLYTAEAADRLFGEPYARVDLASSLTDDPYVGAYISQAPDAKSFPLASRTFDNGLNDGLIQYLTDAINGAANGSAPSAVLETASAGFSQVLQKYGLVSAAPASTQ